MKLVPDKDRRLAAVKETVARLNAERLAAGLPVGFKVGVNIDGVAHVALAGDDVSRPRKLLKRG